jgi:hypothetical protein
MLLAVIRYISLNVTTTGTAFSDYSACGVRRSQHCFLLEPLRNFSISTHMRLFTFKLAAVSPSAARRTSAVTAAQRQN